MESNLEQIQVLLRYEDPGEFLLSELQNVYNDSSSSERPFCDVQLFGRDNLVVHAHSALLAVVSPYMKLILSEVWDPHQGASILLPDFNGSDIQNLIQFLYTGKTSLSGKEFDIFQQIICELQIVTEGERHIILEEITPIHQNADTALVVTEKELNRGVRKSKDKLSEEMVPSLQIPEVNNSKVFVPVPVNLSPFMCPLCSAIFQDETLLKEHQQLQHSESELYELEKDEDEGEQSTGEIIIDEVELILEEDCNPRKNKSIVTCDVKGERPFKCQLCDKSYPVKATLTAHLRLHADDKPHQCERCGKAFLIRSLLEQHLRTHTDERPFSCNICGKAFRNQSNLIGHKKTHTGDRPHLCSICQKSFNRRHDLDAHLRIHSGEKPYPCALCSKSFRFRSALRVHLKGVHKTNA